jgi:DNA-binding LacI/PurR family transcriptional regulator
VDNVLSETAFPSVLADNKGGCQAVTKHLIEVHDHRRITLLRGPAGWISSEERAAGYLAAMQQAGLQPNVVETSDTTIETGQESTLRVLETQPETTAIVAVNDAMAIGAMRVARQLGRQVPGDLAVVGFDNISWATYADPPLTTVRIPKIEMGRLAARLLLERMEGTITAGSRTTITTQLIIRASCGCSEEMEVSNA